MTTKIVWSKQNNIRLNIFFLNNNKQKISDFYNFKPCEYMLLESKSKYIDNIYKSDYIFNLQKIKLINNKSNFNLFEYRRLLLINHL